MKDLNTLCSLKNGFQMLATMFQALTHHSIPHIATFPMQRPRKPHESLSLPRKRSPPLKTTLTGLFDFPPAQRSMATRSKYYLPFRFGGVLHNVHHPGFCGGLHALHPVQDGREVPGQDVRHAGQESPGQKTLCR